MNKALLLFLTLIFKITLVVAQTSIVLADSSLSEDARIDVSVLMTRNGFEAPLTAFEQKEIGDDKGLTFMATRLNEQAIGACGYSWENGDYMAHSCLDYAFPSIDRSSGDSIIIEFDALWEVQQGSGESGRLVACLMHEYPESGPAPGDISNLSGDPFGRPAYNIRILNGSYGAFMGYGGGEDINGKFEVYQSKYWLPGFSARAGGGTIGDGDNYPINSFMEMVDGSPSMSTSQWKHYTWILDKDRQTLLWRNTGDSIEKNERLLFMEMPENGDLGVINAAHGSAVSELPPMYQWFEQINGLRIYWRGVNNFALANLLVSKSGVPLSTYVEFQRDNFRVRESAGQYPLALVMDNPVDGIDTKARVSLISGNSAQVGDFSSEVLTFPADDRGTQVIMLNLVPDQDEVNDTLYFEIDQVEGGRYPTVGRKRSFMLVVRDDVGTGIHPSHHASLQVYPNPASDLIHIEGLQSTSTPIEYILYSLSGSVLARGELNNDHTLSTSMLEAGIYLVNIRTGPESTTLKISIQTTNRNP